MNFDLSSLDKLAAKPSSAKRTRFAPTATARNVRALGGKSAVVEQCLAFSPSTCTHSVSVTAEKACCCPHWEGCEGAGGARRCVGFTAYMQQDNNGPYQHRCPEMVLFCRTEQRPKRRGPVGDAST
jgi:hypothetical protein